MQRNTLRRTSNRGWCGWTHGVEASSQIQTSHMGSFCAAPIQKTGCRAGGPGKHQKRVFRSAKIRIRATTSRRQHERSVVRFSAALGRTSEQELTFVIKCPRFSRSLFFLRCERVNGNGKNAREVPLFYFCIYLHDRCVKNNPTGSMHRNLHVRNVSRVSFTSGITNFFCQWPTRR